MRAARILALGVAIAAMAAAPGCTVLTAVNGFEEIGPRLTCEGDSAHHDFALHLAGFSAHTLHTLRGDVVHVEGTTRTIVGRFVLEPGGSSDISVRMPCLLDDGELYQLDLVADVPGASGMPNGMVDCPPSDPPDPACTDHQWRLDIPADGALDYAHAFDFTDISVDPALPDPAARALDVTLINAATYETEPLEVHVRRCDTPACDGLRRTIYLHRLGAIPATASLTLPGAGTIAEGTTLALAGQHEIAYWIDVNHDGVYQPPAADGTARDVSWRVELLTDVDGLHPTLDADDPTTVFVDVGI